MCEDPAPIAEIQLVEVHTAVAATSVVTCSGALNNRGEIAMTVFSENPETFDVRTFVVKARPRK